ncbi:MAG TPA: N-acetyltransferase [Sporolactobacillaceae bacterium]|nr:N-acetyltransferase [Sporolactobacillaceae bacterium]
MYKLRAEIEEDHAAIREVNDLAFHYGDESKLVDNVRESDRYIPELSIIAVTEDNKVIGHILFSVIDIESENGVLQTLALAPMAVRPDFQGQGIGSALVRHGLSECKRLGYGHVVLIGHPDFYPRFGFKPAREKGLESPIPVPDHVFLACELDAGALESVSGTIKYPPAFYFDGKLI